MYYLMRGPWSRTMVDQPYLFEDWFKRRVDDCIDSFGDDSAVTQQGANKDQSDPEQQERHGEE